MLKFIGKQFEKPSGLFGRIVSALMKKGNIIYYDKILPELDIQQGDNILEIGFGHGIGLDIICTNYECNVTGIDFSKLMFDESTKRNKKHINNKKLTLKLGDYLKIDNSTGCFNIIFFINVIYFWPDLNVAFNKLYSDLTNNGKLCIYMATTEKLSKLKFTSDDIFNKYTIEYVCEELKRTGFTQIKYKNDNGYYISCKKTVRAE